MSFAMARRAASRSMRCASRFTYECSTAALIISAKAVTVLMVRLAVSCAVLKNSVKIPSGVPGVLDDSSGVVMSDRKLQSVCWQFCRKLQELMSDVWIVLLRFAMSLASQSKPIKLSVPVCSSPENPTELMIGKLRASGEINRTNPAEAPIVLMVLVRKISNNVLSSPIRGAVISCVRQISAPPPFPGGVNSGSRNQVNSLWMVSEMGIVFLRITWQSVRKKILQSQLNLSQGSKIELYNDYPPHQGYYPPPPIWL